MKKHILTVAILSLLLSGCAGKHVSKSEAKPTSSQAVQSSNAPIALPTGNIVSNVVVNIDTSRLHQDRIARANKYSLVQRITSGVTSGLQEANHFDSVHGKTTVDITVTNFRLRSGAAAFWLGVLDGADKISVDVKIEQGSKAIREFQTNTSTAIGGLIRPAPSQRINRMVKTLSKRIVSSYLLGS